MRITTPEAADRFRDATNGNSIDQLGSRRARIDMADNSKYTASSNPWAIGGIWGPRPR